MPSELAGRAIDRDQYTPAGTDSVISVHNADRSRGILWHRSTVAEPITRSLVATCIHDKDRRRSVRRAQALPVKSALGKTESVSAVYAA